MCKFSQQNVIINLKKNPEFKILPSLTVAILENGGHFEFQRGNRGFYNQ